MTDLEDAVAALHASLIEVEALPDPAARRSLARALDALRRVHEEGVRRLASLALGNPDAARVALSDPLVANLLHLYGVTDASEGPSVVEVVENGGPGGDSYRVRLDSGDTVSFVPEASLQRLAKRMEAAPVGPAAAASEGAPPGRPSARGPRDVAGADELDRDGGLMGRLVHGYPVLVVRVGDGARAYRNTCPGSLLPLHLGGLEDGAIRCPWHGCRFDPASGDRVDGPGEGLQPLPVEVRGGRLWVELP